MIRKILIALVVLIVLLVGSIFLLGKTVLAKVLENSIGAPVSIGRFHIDLSKVGIYDIKVMNPEGFSNSPLASIPEIFIEYDAASMFGAKKHIRIVKLNVDEITVEKKGLAVNLLELGAVKSLKKGSQTSQTSAGKTEKSGHTTGEKCCESERSN